MHVVVVASGVRGGPERLLKQQSSKLLQLKLLVLELTAVARRTCTAKGPVGLLQHRDVAR